MASYTTNYQLHQWEANDDFLRTDFNEDFAKIDAGIKSAADAAAGAASTAAGRARIVTGSYTGNGSTGRVISVGATPRILFISQNAFVTTLIQDANTTADAVIITNGFRLDDYSINTPGRTYPYLAVL